jgi:hypothetical protein
LVIAADFGTLVFVAAGELQQIAIERRAKIGLILPIQFEQGLFGSIGEAQSSSGLGIFFPPSIFHKSSWAGRGKLIRSQPYVLIEIDSGLTLDV